MSVTAEERFTLANNKILVGDASSNPIPTSLGTLSESTSSVLILAGWTNATVGSPTIQVKQASGSQAGYLSSTDWTTFNNKQAAGNYITALTGDATASGPGSVSLTLATVNSNTGTFGSTSVIPSFTVNGKGLITAVSSVTSTATPTASIFAGWDANKNLSANNLIDGYTTTATAGGTTTLTVASTGLQYFTGTTTQTVLLPVVSTLSLGLQFIITNLSTGTVTVQSSGANTLQAMAANTVLVATVISTTGTGTASWSWTYNLTSNGNSITALTGDVTATGPGSVAATLATVNSNTGSFGSSTAIPSFTVNAKGLITAASTNAVVAPAGTLTGTTLASNVVSSSLTSVGTITTGVWNGTTIAVANGGTNNGSLAVTAGGVTYTDGSKIVNTGAGTQDQYLKSNAAGAPTWSTFTRPTVQVFTSSTTYTTPAGVKWIKVKAVGGGGAGGGGGNQSNVGVGGGGGATSFGSVVTCNGGSGGSTGVAAMGSVVVNSPGISINSTGAEPGRGFIATDTTAPNGIFGTGGIGGSNPLGGGGGGVANGVGGAASGWGAGGGGGGFNATGGVLKYALSGGGSGGYAEVIIPSPNATYTVTIGGNGTIGGGNAGTNGFSGGNGTQGIVIVEEHYQ